MTEDELREMRQFHAELEEYVGKNPDDPVRENAEIAQWLRFQELYPGEYVAYLDEWEGTTPNWTVLAHDADLGKIFAAAERWPEETQERVKVDYFNPVYGPPGVPPDFTGPRPPS